MNLAAHSCCSAGCTGSEPGCRIQWEVGSWWGAAARSCFAARSYSVARSYSADHSYSAGSKCSDRNYLVEKRSSCLVGRMEVQSLAALGNFQEPGNCSYSVHILGLVDCSLLN